MKGILYYFSGTGNTKWIAEKFKEQFNSYGKQLELKNIEGTEEIKLNSYDYLIIGTPVHAEMPPKIVMDLLERLPRENNNIKCIVFSTQGSKSAAAVDYLKELMEKKGYNVMVQTSFRMANNYYFGTGTLRSEEEIEGFSSSAEEKVKYVTKQFFKNNRVVETVGKIRIFTGKIAHKSFYKFLPKLSTNLAATEECNKCGLCLRNCPRGNITLEEGHALFHRNCIMCVRCIHICPINAIRYKGKKIEQIQKDRIKILDLK